MTLTTVVKKEYEIRNLGEEMLEFALNDEIDEDYQLYYRDLTTTEKLLFLKGIQKQFNAAVEKAMQGVL